MREKGFTPILILAIALLLGIVVFFTLQQNKYPKTTLEEKSGPENTSDNSSPPGNLSLPFKVENISFSSGILNPLGIIRNNEDNGLGHGGIDFPLTPSTKVTAVMDGEIVEIGKTSNLAGDEKLVLLLDKTADGEGWIFLYEHLLLDSSLKVGDKIKRGDTLATHILDARTSHYQLSKAFNNYEYYEPGVCWPELLKGADQSSLNNFWNIYRKSDYPLGAWNSITNDGSYSYRALLDKSKYPNGVQLCYEGDTDARAPIN